TLLLLAGLASLYSIGSTGNQALLIHQLVALGVGVLFFGFGYFIDYRKFALRSGVIYATSVILLVAVLLFGADIRGARGWITLPGFSFQPVEFAKIALIIGLARFFSRKRGEIKDLKVLFHSAIFLVIPVLLAIAQPDMGSAIILCAIWFGMLLVTPVRKTHIVGLLIFLAILGVVGWQTFLHDYQKQRLITFVQPEADPQGSGYNVRQSVIAVGSGQFEGRGLGKGYQSHLRFLPERHTDFIFASFAEELGFIGSLLLIAVFGLLLWRLIGLAALAPDSLGMYLIVGVAVLIAVQLFINVGMNIGIMPVTGITLPLLSYGGSSLVSTLFLFGLVQNVYSKSREGSEVLLN
ncbi:MAG TPA: rod shape-determining protein RodA, partial [Flavobacterium sp.]|nr:rod shape-determining protein RodA [Flavobacterium sp.]